VEGGGARSTAYSTRLNVFNNGNVDGNHYNYNNTRTSYVPNQPVLAILAFRWKN